MNHPLLVVFITLLLQLSITMNDHQLQDYLESCKQEFNLIEDERKEVLQELAEYLFEQISVEQNKSIPLNFICTHNSRRSHLGQIWCAVAADYYGVEDHFTYFSGGTEVTAFNERAVAALKRAGVTVVNSQYTANPVYTVHYSRIQAPIKAFSKRYNDPYNPQHGFVAILTCTDAEKNCPVVFGAIYRIGIAYEDPKSSDGLPDESQVYDTRCKQIAREMMYMIRYYTTLL
jgi:arsenate reductase